MTDIRRLAALALAAALALGVSGCVGPPVTSSHEPEAPVATDHAPAPVDPIERAPDSCEWESPRVDAAPEPPSGQAGEFATVLVGSWQHTHFDSGSGWEAASNDIRYVFPTVSQLLYCQHVPGVTEHAENRAEIALQGSLILPPDPHPGFEAIAWSADRMVWVNNVDGSRYLLVRR